MGIDSDFGRAFAKAQVEAGNSLPLSGCVLVSARREDHAEIAEPVRVLAGEGFRILATAGTAATLNEAGVESEVINKVREGSPHTVDAIDGGSVDLVINTVDHDPESTRASFAIRRVALQRGVPYCTTLAAAKASASAIQALRQESIGVRSLQQIHALLVTS